MTSRVCPVHGEYAADGVCRWCESESANTWEADHPGSTRCRCGKYAWAPGAAELNYVDPDCVAHTPEHCFALDAKPPEPEYTEAVITADMNAAEESRLLAQHAALRWERVARRWNYKHRRPGGLDERERAYVWRSWLEQQQRIFDDSDWLRRQQERFIAAGVPKEWP